MVIKSLKDMGNIELRHILIFQYNLKNCYLLRGPHPMNLWLTPQQGFDREIGYVFKAM